MVCFVFRFVWFLGFFLFWPLGGNTPWPACRGSTPRPSTSCVRFTPSARGKSTAALPMHLIRRVRSTLRAAGVLQRRLKLVLFRRVFVVFVIFSFYICNTPFYLLHTVYTIRKKRKKRSTTTTCCFCYCFYLLFLSLVFFLVFVPFFFWCGAASRCRFPLPHRADSTTPPLLKGSA